MNIAFFEYLMRLADYSYKNGDVPISAAIVKNGEIVSAGYNTRELTNCILGHAEINAINELCKKNNNWNLSEYDLYVTLKPCSMCMEIIKQTRIRNVYYLLDKPDNKKEFSKTVLHKINDDKEEKVYKEILNNFFKEIRDKR